jgi:chemotaxis response regulator CheB
MSDVIKSINKLCNRLLESEQIDIHGENYNKKEVITFARKYDPTVITLSDALDIIRRLDLFQEIKRVLCDKDDSYNYNVMGA